MTSSGVSNKINRHELQVIKRIQPEFNFFATVLNYFVLASRSGQSLRRAGMSRNLSRNRNICYFNIIVILFTTVKQIPEV